MQPAHRVYIPVTSVRAPGSGHPWPWREMLHICVPEETAGPLHDVGLHGSACKYTCGLVCMCVLFKCWAVNAPAVCPGSAKVGISLGGTGEGLERILSPEQRGEVMGQHWA